MPENCSIYTLWKIHSSTTASHVHSITQSTTENFVFRAHCEKWEDVLEKKFNDGWDKKGGTKVKCK